MSGGGGVVGVGGCTGAGAGVEAGDAGGGVGGRGFGSCRHGPEETTERFLLRSIQLGQPDFGE